MVSYNHQSFTPVDLKYFLLMLHFKNFLYFKSTFFCRNRCQIVYYAKIGAHLNFSLNLQVSYSRHKISLGKSLYRTQLSAQHLCKDLKKSTRYKAPLILRNLKNYQILWVLYDYCIYGLYLIFGNILLIYPVRIKLSLGEWEF